MDWNRYSHAEMALYGYPTCRYCDSCFSNIWFQKMIKPCLCEGFIHESCLKMEIQQFSLENKETKRPMKENNLNSYQCKTCFKRILYFDEYKSFGISLCELNFCEVFILLIFVILILLFVGGAAALLVFDILKEKKWALLILIPVCIIFIFRIQQIAKGKFLKDKFQDKLAQSMI